MGYGPRDYELAITESQPEPLRETIALLDAGYYTLMNIQLNVAVDSILERPEFVGVRDRLRGDWAPRDPRPAGRGAPFPGGIP